MQLLESHQHEDIDTTPILFSLSSSVKVSLLLQHRVNDSHLLTRIFSSLSLHVKFALLQNNCIALNPEVKI